VPSEDELAQQMAKNAELFDQGKLSQNAMWLLNEQLQDQIQAQCSHSKTEKDDHGDKGYILWCANDRCGVMVANHMKNKSDAKEAGTVGKTTKPKSGCVVVGIALLGALSSLIWWAADVVSTVL
jgi:hypothetical protein